MTDRQNPKVATFQHANLSHVPIRNKWVEQLRKLVCAKGFIEKRPEVVKKVKVD